MENRYSDLNLAKEKVKLGHHRQFIGGMWDQIGGLQFEYLKSKGLKSHHRLLDVGCGSLRGGVHFIPYLDPYKYYGFDLNMSLIQAGLDVEIKNLGFSDRVDIKNFAAAANFEYPEHWPEMDAAVGISLLTHLNYDSLCLCLKKTAKYLKVGARFYATIFEVASGAELNAFEQIPGIITHASKDPYHYTRSKIEAAARLNGLECVSIEDFSHPRNQKMVIFERSV